MAAFVVVLMPADDEVDVEAVEKWQPVLPDAEVGSVGAVARRDRGLMHAHHDPVNPFVAARAFEFLFEPTLLGAAGVATDAGIAAVLITHVVVGQADHPDRSRRERVPQSSQLLV